jgi:DNA-binding transcriptional ArsR family regulator
MEDDPQLRRTLWFLLGGKRGGENRVRIIRSIRDRPRNMNQLANDLHLQHRTIQHHLRILVSNSLVVTSGERYGMIFLLSPWFESHIEAFDRICEKLGFDHRIPYGEGEHPS